MRMVRRSSSGLSLNIAGAALLFICAKILRPNQRLFHPPATQLLPLLKVVLLFLRE
jgi:hypothetical protein